MFMAWWQHATVLHYHRLHVQALLSRCLNSRIQQAQGEFSGGNEVVTSYQLSEGLCTTRLYREVQNITQGYDQLSISSGSEDMEEI